jgi:hypothetical protein
MLNNYGLKKMFRLEKKSFIMVIQIYPTEVPNKKISNLESVNS